MERRGGRLLGREGAPGEVKPPITILLTNPGPAYTSPVYICTSAAPISSRRFASSADMIPPTLTTGRRPSNFFNVNPRIVSLSRPSGVPLKPPLSCRQGEVNLSRSRLVFVTMTPSIPVRRIASRASSSSSSFRSGASFTSKGRCFSNLVSSSFRWAPSCVNNSSRAARPCSAPQPHRIGRADIDGQVIRQLGEVLQQRQVIEDGLLIGGCLVLPDVHPQDDRCRAQRRHGSAGSGPKIESSPAGGLAQRLHDRLRSLARKPHPVDDGFILHQPEDPRFGIARLRQRCDRPDLNVAESQCGDTSPGQAVLVITRCQSHRIGKMQPKDVHRFFR